MNGSELPEKMPLLRLKFLRVTRAGGLLEHIFARRSDALRELEHSLIVITKEGIERAHFLQLYLDMLNHADEVKNPREIEAYLETLIVDLNQFCDALITLRTDGDTCPLRPLRIELHTLIRNGGLYRETATPIDLT